MKGEGRRFHCRAVRLDRLRKTMKKFAKMAGGPVCIASGLGKSENIPAADWCNFSRPIQKHYNLSTTSRAYNTSEFPFTTKATFKMHATCSHLSSSHSHKTVAVYERS
jgi:hypothetical protein